MPTLSGELELWQANDLVEAVQALTLNEKRLVLALVALHDPRKPMAPSATITVTAAEFADVFDISRGHAYEALRDAAVRLGQRWIRDTKLGPQRSHQQCVRWIWHMEHRKGSGAVKLGLAPGLAPYLTLLHGRFTTFKLRHIAAIGSVHGLRLYELMAQCLTTGERSIKLDRLREILDLAGKYADIKNLRARVLEPSIAAINQHTDLRVTMTPERQGRKVVGFHFAIRRDPAQPVEDEP